MRRLLTSSLVAASLLLIACDDPLPILVDEEATQSRIASSHQEIHDARQDHFRATEDAVEAASDSVDQALREAGDQALQLFEPTDD